VLRRIFGPKKEEVTGGWRKLNCCINMVIKSRTIMGVGHMACKVEMENALKILVQWLKGRNHLGYIDINGKTTEEWIFRETEFVDVNWAHVGRDKVHW
jgi:hypothetical protein